MVSNMDRALFGSIVLVGLGLGFNAEACSTDGWAGGTSNIPANGQAASPPGVARYSEFCALRINGQAHVQSDYASDTHYRARFYVLDGLTGGGDVEVFEAYSDSDGSATTPLFKISFNGSQFTFDASDAGGNSAAAASVAGWNVIEFDWNSDAGTFDYWVNADASTDAATGTIDSGAGTVETVRLGAPNGFAGQTGFINFDAFESHRTTPVGVLLAGDANNSGTISIADAVAILNELNGTLQAGQPDCNENGGVTVADAVCLLNSL